MSNAHSAHADHPQQPDPAGVLPRVLLTPEEAAQALGISRSKLYELLRAGTLESVRIDRLRRIPIQALHEFVQRLREA
jgi:excisionase family DNA binding protein